MAYRENYPKIKKLIKQYKYNNATTEDTIEQIMALYGDVSKQYEVVDQYTQEGIYEGKSRKVIDGQIFETGINTIGPPHDLTKIIDE